MQIVIDIETIPSQQPGAKEYIRASIKPPGQMKLAATIEKWWKDDAEAAIETEYRRQSLDGGLCGEIISISMVCPSLDDGGPIDWVYCRRQGESEASLLTMFSASVVELIDREAKGQAGHELNWAQDPYFIAHNAAFDLPFIWHRCLVNGIKLPFKFPTPNSREGKDYGCTMVRWAGHGGRVSLDALCGAFNIDSPKGDMDGSQVFDTWLAGKHELIANYNLADAIATAEVWARLQGGAS